MYSEKQIATVFRELEFLKEQNIADWSAYFYKNHAKFYEQLGEFTGQNVSDCLKKFKTLQETFDAFR